VVHPTHCHCHYPRTPAPGRFRRVVSLRCRWCFLVLLHDAMRVWSLCRKGDAPAGPAAALSIDKVGWRNAGCALRLIVLIVLVMLVPPLLLPLVTVRAPFQRQHPRARSSLVPRPPLVCPFLTRRLLSGSFSYPLLLNPLLTCLQDHRVTWSGPLTRRCSASACCTSASPPFIAAGAPAFPPAAPLPYSTAH